jgi:predicted O-methyltransferase YrrM
VIERFARKLPIAKKLIRERDNLSILLTEEKFKNEDLALSLQKAATALKSLEKACASFVPPGHFYSPLPSITEIRECEDKIFSRVPRKIEGVDICEAEQISLFDRLCEYYEEMPYRPNDAIYDEVERYKGKILQTTDEDERKAITRDALDKFLVLIEENKPDNLRYLLDNPNYGYTDGIILYCMIRHLKPKRIIEVGSGYSSCLILDVNELFFGDSIDLTAIEPHPEMLLSLISENDSQKISLLRAKLQDVDTRLFNTLEADDILFIDSSHVSKIYSDVNWLFFEILPRVARGVYIHFHDIFYPFEYPKEWVYEGRAWNESYMLRAFLLYNNFFKTVLFTSFLQHFHKDYIETRIPLFARCNGGSIWIQKV